MAVTLTCYGGASEIGGNKILLEDGDKRYMFDFGRSYPRYGKYFDDMFLKERTSRGLLDPLALEIIPPLRGLLRDNLLPALDPTQIKDGKLKPDAADKFWNHWRTMFPDYYRDLRRDNAPAVDVILISHAHQDHISDLEYVEQGIPAVSTAMTAFISKVLLDGSSGSSGGPYLSPRFYNEEGLLTGSISGTSDSILLRRPWHFLDGALQGDVTEPIPILDNPAAFWNKSISKKKFDPPPAPALQNLLPKWWSVDHSIYGGVGFAIETEIGWVAYTGDIRFSGVRGDDTRKFGEALRKLGVKVLLCEGTRLTDPNATTEREVAEKCLSAVQTARGKLVVADFSQRHVERLQTFLKIAVETKRHLVIQARDAYLLRAMFLADSSITDLMASPPMRILAEPKKPTGVEPIIQERYRDIYVDSRAIADDPASFILCCNSSDLTDLLDVWLQLGKKPGGTYIFSNSSSHDDEGAADLRRLLHWTQVFDFKLVGLKQTGATTASGESVLTSEEGYHASGHAAPNELVEFVETVQPDVLVPIHTQAPTKWHDLLRNPDIITQPTYAKSIPLG